MTVFSSSARLCAVSVAVSVSVLAAGCGGGGGGSTTAAALPGKSNLLYVPASAATIAGVQAQGGQGATLTTSGATASLVTGGINTGALGAVATAVPSNTTNYTNASGSTNLMVSKETGGTALTDASYGIVTTTSGGNSYLGAYHYGTLTPTTAMPTTTATYTGKFVGLEVNSSASIRGLVGNSSLTANFGAGTVTGAVTGITTTSNTFTNYGIGMNGTISGNTYSGTSAFTSAIGAAPGTTTASTMNGAFYGANATQTAGSLTLQGTPTYYSALAVTGAFGGRR